MAPSSFYCGLHANNVTSAEHQEMFPSIGCNGFIELMVDKLNKSHAIMQVVSPFTIDVCVGTVNELEFGWIHIMTMI